MPLYWSYCLAGDHVGVTHVHTVQSSQSSAPQLGLREALGWGGTIGTIPLAKGTGDESTKINKRSKRGLTRVSTELNLRRSDMDCNMAREVRLTQLPGDRRDRSILSDLRDRIKVHLSSQAHRCKKTSMALLNVDMQSVK